ncbi:MAG: hypothetical protein IJA07_08050 [Agathobacter sp.]|nr:hypothetical protein [Agathobacter sp.]
MSNFIDDLDVYYVKNRIREKIPIENNLYTVYLPLTFYLGKIKNRNFIVRKKNTKKKSGEERKTQFIYTRQDARVYFADSDILEMLMDIKSEVVLKEILEKLKQLYQGIGCSYNFVINRKKYEIKGIEIPKYCQLLQNKKDIPLEYDDLMVLIILVLAKDQAAAEDKELKYHKRTLAKYISLLEWYKFNNENARKYLEDIEFPWEAAFETNFSTAKKAKDLHKLFPQEEIFERSGLL